MWDIIPLDLGTINNPAKGLVPVTAWLLVHEKTKRKIMVDAGPSENETWGTMYHNPFTRNDNQLLETALAKYETKIQDIDTVILTHLHWDHAYGILKMPQTRVIVQKSELQYAITPYPPDQKHYETNIKTQLPFFLNFYHQIQIVEGDMMFENGIFLLTLPGHSPGSQGVIVDTKDGKYLIAGDLISFSEDWEQRKPTLIYNSLADVYKSYNKIAKLEVVVLAAHDYKVF